MAEKKRAWLTVDLGENGKHSFSSVDDVRRWVEEDRRAWEWMPDNVEQNRPTHKSSWESRRRAVLEGINEDDSKGNIQELLKVAYVNKGLVHADSPKGRFVDFLRRQPSGQNDAILFLHSGRNAQETQTRRLLEVVFKWSPVGARARLFRDEERSTTLFQQLAKSRKEYDGAIADLKRRHERGIEGLKTRVDELVDEKTAALDEKRAGWDGEFKELLGSAHEEFEKEKQIYQNELRLKAPVEYWEDEGRRNRTTARIFGVTFAVSLLVVLGILGFSTAEIIQFIGTEPNIVKGAVLLFGASLILWLLKMFSRLFLSAYHRAEDASERVTMIKAYLALLRDEEVGKDQLALALASVFRPSATGIINDETMPQWNATAILQKLISGGK